MKGYSHALTGAAGWLAITNAAPLPAAIFGDNDLQLGVNLLNAAPEVALTGSVLMAGGAMTPDGDHRNSTIAHSLPPLSNIACAGIEKISGGHRHGTHSLIGILAFTLLAWLASFITIEIEGRTVALGAGLVAVPLVAIAMKGLGIRLGRRGSVLNTSLGPWIVSVGTAGLATYYLDYQWTWLPLAVGLGAFVHCLGDALTIQGVPWLWPWNPAPPKKLRSLPVIGPLVKITWQNNGYFRFALLGETTSWRETIFATVVGLYVIVSMLTAMSALVGL